MPPPTYPPPRPKVRLAKWSDTARMAEIAAEAFDQNDLCGRFMHPHRHQFPADYITFWRQEIRSHLFEPDVYFLVSTVPAEVGADKEGGNVDDEKAAVLVVGVAKWKRQGKTKSPFSSWIHVLLHHTLTLTTHISRLLWPNRAADPSRANSLSRAFPFFAHHWSGPRAQTWFLDMLCVHPLFQNRGHGRELVQWGKDRARRDGVCASLTAAEGKEGFYSKMGFEEVGRANVGPLEGADGGGVMFCDEP